MVKVAISIVNYNLKEVIPDCLRSLQKLVKDSYELEIIVVDNHSSDGSQDEIPREFPDITYLPQKTNDGYTGGNNVGITYALEHGADYVVILNPDVLVDPNLIEELLKGFENLSVGITVPKVYFAAGFEFHKDRYSEKEKGNVIWYAGGVMDWANIIGHHRGVDEVDTGQYNMISETDYATGNCMMVKKALFDKVGLFDDRYFMYYEDADFSMRAKQAGYKILYLPQAILWHKNAQAAGGSGSTLQDYFITRNRLLFGFRYGSLRTKAALARESFRNALHNPLRRKAAKDFYLRQFGKGTFL